jgi:hypothetical protein
MGGIYLWVGSIYGWDSGEPYGYMYFVYVDTYETVDV